MTDTQGLGGGGSRGSRKLFAPLLDKRMKTLIVAGRRVIVAGHSGGPRTETEVCGSWDVGVE